MREYRFLIDSDSQAASKFFPDKRIVTLTQAKLSPAASDAAVVARARELGCILSRRMGPTLRKRSSCSFKNRSERTCYDLFGLVVIPNSTAIQERVLSGHSATL